MSSIRRSFFRAAKRQVRTAELGNPILRLLLGLALALDVMAGHPLWATLALVATIATVFWRGALAIRREATGNHPSPDCGATSPEESL